MEGIYKVNLIPSDLSTEETILQIAETLDNLNGIVEDVFARLMRRIAQNTDKTKKLKERIETSKTKVEKLTGMQTAIKVFSSAKYPASITHEHYLSVFGLDGYQHQPQKVFLRGKTQGQPNEKGIQVILIQLSLQTTLVRFQFSYICLFILGKAPLFPRKSRPAERPASEKRFQSESCYQ